MTNYILLVYMWKKYYIICGYQNNETLINKVSIILTPTHKNKWIKKIRQKVGQYSTLLPPTHIYIYKIFIQPNK